MTPPPDSLQTPKAMRNLSLLAMLLASFVGMFSLSGALSMGQLQRQRAEVAQQRPTVPFINDPDVVVAITDTQVAVLEGMKGSRGLVLGALAITCMVIFMTAGRLVRWYGLPREGVRKVLSGALVVAAVLRVIDGAQWSVVSQRVAKAAAPMLAKQAEGGDAAARIVERLLPTVSLAGSILVTALVAGTFLLLAQYFRSERVRKVVATQDAALERNSE